MNEWIWFEIDHLSHRTFLSAARPCTLWARSQGLSGCCREGFSSCWRSSCGWSCSCGPTGSSWLLCCWRRFYPTHSWWIASEEHPETWRNPFVLRWMFVGLPDLSVSVVALLIYTNREAFICKHKDLLCQTMNGINYFKHMSKEKHIIHLDLQLEYHWMVTQVQMNTIYSACVKERRGLTSQVAHVISC